MEEAPASATRKQRTLQSVCRLFLFAAIATTVAWVLKPPSNPEPLTLFLDHDGTFSYDRQGGEKLSSSEIKHWRTADHQAASGHLILDCFESTKVCEWDVVISELEKRGYVDFQLRIPNETMNFHLPVFYGRTYRTGATQQLIKLGESRIPGINQEADVYVEIGKTTTCGELISATRKYRAAGTSMFIVGNSVWARSSSEDQDHQPPKRSLADKLRGILPR
ncbi:hypothetical protein [Luteolibacter soli]|uniref:Uncharacterized protein n=1 Tax=Luteolibacter soli TaxID=3135280 RepID=A0ABU9AX20_9BACT